MLYNKITEIKMGIQRRSQPHISNERPFCPEQCHIEGLVKGAIAKAREQAFPRQYQRLPRLEQSTDAFIARLICHRLNSCKTGIICQSCKAVEFVIKKFDQRKQETHDQGKNNESLVFESASVLLKSAMSSTV